MRSQKHYKLSEEDLTKGIESLDLPVLKWLTDSYAPEFHALLKTDYAIRGCLDFRHESFRRTHAFHIRKAAFTSLLIQVRKKFKLKSSKLAFYVAEEVGQSGEHYHFHFGIADHRDLHGRETEIAEFIKRAWQDGVVIHGDILVNGRCKAEKFDNSRKADGILYDCKREFHDSSLKMPFISKELMRRLKNN
ncbi:MAG: hypothetical protein ACKVG9_13115 [Rhodospirillales bacterium]